MCLAINNDLTITTGMVMIHISSAITIIALSFHIKMTDFHDARYILTQNSPLSLAD